jgi:DNA-binding XRE family transcriptional regulator
MAGNMQLSDSQQAAARFELERQKLTSIEKEKATPDASS